MSPCHLCDKRNQENGISREQQGPSGTGAGALPGKVASGAASERLPHPRALSQRPSRVYHESVRRPAVHGSVTPALFQRSDRPPPSPLLPDERGATYHEESLKR